MATALVLVNRVRRMLRVGDTAAFDDEQSKVVLDRVNDAIATIHSLFDWECDRRVGALVTYPSTDTANVTTAGITVAAVSDNGSALRNLAVVASNALTRAVLQMTIPADATDTVSAVRVLGGAGTGLASALYLDTGWPGTGGVSVTIRTVACEYGLPSTVREILSVKSQVEGAYLHDATGEDWLEAFARRPHLTVSNRALAFVSRRENYPTVDGGIALPIPTVTNTLSKTILVYPTPSTAYRLDYEYLHEYAVLSNPTDAYDGPPRAIEDIVTALAYARCTQDSVGDADPASGLAMEQRVLERASLLHRQLGLRRDLTGGDRQEMILRGIPTTGERAG